jgi:glycosyltransferase involved in cell wall biosynthesis
MKKILIGSNILTAVSAEAYLSHCQFWTYVGEHLKDKMEVIFYCPPRASIDRMRNTAAKLALEHECDYLMFYDDDVLFEPNTLERMLWTISKNYISVVSALTYIRGYPFQPMIFRWAGEGVKSFEGDGLYIYEDWEDAVTEENRGIIDCGAVGFSCVLLEVEPMKTIEPPYFITGPHNTEDVFYCVKLQREFPEKRIVCDTKIRTTHMMRPYGVNYENAQDLKEFEEKHYFQEEVKGDRGKEYLEKCQNQKLEPVNLT